MRWRQFSRLLAVAALLHACIATAQRGPSADVPALPAQPAEQATETVEQRSKLTDAAVIALIIAASIKLYKATRGPCACPTDTMRNGRACNTDGQKVSIFITSRPAHTAA